MSDYSRQFTLKELGQLFILTSFTVNLMAILNTLYLIPAWSYYMSLEEIVGSVSYTLCFILVETVLMFLGLVVIGAIWPRRWTDLRPVIISIIFLLQFAVGTILFRIFVGVKQPYGFLIAASLLLMIFVIYRSFRAQKIGPFFLSLADRVTVLSFIYLVFNFAGVIVVFIRNL